MPARLIHTRSAWRRAINLCADLWRFIRSPKCRL